MFDAGLAGDALELLATAADDHGLVAGLVDDHRGVDAAQVALDLELLDLDRDAVGQFVAEQAEELLAQDSEARKRSLRSVVGPNIGVPTGQARGGLTSLSTLRPFSADSGTISVKSRASRTLGDEGAAGGSCPSTGRPC